MPYIYHTYAREGAAIKPSFNAILVSGHDTVEELRERVAENTLRIVPFGNKGEYHETNGKNVYFFAGEEKPSWSGWWFKKYRGLEGAEFREGLPFDIRGEERQDIALFYDKSDYLSLILWVRKSDRRWEKSERKLRAILDNRFEKVLWGGKRDRLVVPGDRREDHFHFYR